MTETKRIRPAGNGADHDSSISVTPDSTEYCAATRRRRLAGHRSEPDEYGVRDPWCRPRPWTARGLADALDYLDAAGLTGMAPQGVMREAWADADAAQRPAIERAARAVIA